MCGYLVKAMLCCWPALVCLVGIELLKEGGYPSFKDVVHCLRLRINKKSQGGPKKATRAPEEFKNIMDDMYKHHL